VKNLIREVSEIRIPKNNAPHVLAAGVAYPLLPDLHISAVGTIVSLYAYLLGICLSSHSEAWPF
jgi:hypothetical protein